MTLEQMFETSDAEALAKLTDVELQEHFKPFLSVTRPELAPKRNLNREPERVYVSPVQQATLQLLRDNGIEVGKIMKKMRK